MRLRSQNSIYLCASADLPALYLTMTARVIRTTASITSTAHAVPRASNTDSQLSTTSTRAITANAITSCHGLSRSFSHHRGRFAIMIAPFLASGSLAVSFYRELPLDSRQQRAVAASLICATIVSWRRSHGGSSERTHLPLSAAWHATMWR